ncbi:hypothetical protein GOP47_0030323 [Adiantum capillus-veneris]|nr:hypothetical protein GOP47_0030323 [Adiantum capillus-veneris]
MDPPDQVQFCSIECKWRVWLEHNKVEIEAAGSEQDDDEAPVRPGEQNADISMDGQINADGENVAAEGETPSVADAAVTTNEQKAMAAPDD